MRIGIKAWALAVVMIAAAFCLINTFPLDADDVVYTDTYVDDDISVSYTDYIGTGGTMGLFDMEFLTTVPSNPVRVSIDGGSLTSPLILDGNELHYATEPRLAAGQHNVLVTGGNLYAKQFTITLAKYVVSFDMQGHGTQVIQQTVDHNGKAIKPTDPSAAGYVFGGWFKEAACSNAWNFDEDQVTGDVKLYAKWTENQVTVKFNSNGGSGTMTDQVIKYSDSSKALKANSFTRSEYTFSGWAKTQSGSVVYQDKAAIPVSEITSPTATLQLYAIWTASPGPGPGPGPGPTPETYTVTFVVEPEAGGTVSKTSISGISLGTTITASGNTVSIGSGPTAKTVTATAASGYTFKEWKDIPSTGTVNSNFTVKAVFEQGTVPITVEVANGSVTIPASVVKDLDIKDPSKLVLTIEKVTPTLSIIPADAVCYQITLKYDGKVLSTFSSAIEVLLKFTPPTGADVSKLKVYFVSDDGKKVENMNGSYDSSKKGMKFGSKHLSVFAITQNTIEPVPAVLSSITVKTAPAKVAYKEGEKFDPTGLVLTLKYDDGTSKSLDYKGNESKFTFSPSTSTPLKVSDKSVTITYEGKTTTQAITVTAEPAPSGGDNTVLFFVVAIIIVVALAGGIFYFIRRNASP